MRILKINNNNYYQNFTGWSPKTLKNKENVEKVNEILENNNINSIAVCAHKFPDGDAIGSVYAMAYLLNKKTGVKPDVYLFGNIPTRFSYLQNPKKVNTLNYTNKEIEPKNYDLAVALDVHGPHLIKEDFVTNIFNNAKHTLKVDHHIKPNDFADINIVDTDSSSAAQVVMQLVNGLKINPKELPPEFNNAVYTGLITDSKNFTVATRKSSFDDASLLVENGLDVINVTQNTYTNLPKEVFEMIKLAQDKVKFELDGKLAYIFEDDELYEFNKKANDPDLEYDLKNCIKDFNNDLLKNEGVEVALYISEREKGKFYVSARSNRINIKNLAEQFGYGGHPKASSFYYDIKGSKKETLKEILEIYKNYINNNL